jgi:NAD(P)-dependent dehydrogenase (short-subunit alcohol dehydrogenase family)
LGRCIDLASSADIDRCVSQIRSVHNSIDAVINNAAELITKTALDTRIAEWDQLLATNVRSISQLSSLLHPLLLPTKGCIVNVASVHALATSPGVAAYAASKGAVVALTRAMALEFASDGIRVNSVLPGAVETSMLTEGLTRSGKPIAEALRSLAAAHPLGRIGKPEDIAEAIYFLADSGRAAFITGQMLVVDGGATARLSTE